MSLFSKPKKFIQSYIRSNSVPFDTQCPKIIELDFKHTLHSRPAVLFGLTSGLNRNNHIGQSIFQTSTKMTILASLVREALGELYVIDNSH